MRTALIQMNASSDKAANIKKANRFVEQAFKKRTRFVLLPEVFSWRGTMNDAQARIAAIEPIEGPSLRPLRTLCQQYGGYVLAGSILEKSLNKNKAYNTSVLIGSHGEIVAKYRKNHLFDARIDGKIINEGDFFCAGTKANIARVDAFNVGMSICYDLRFAEFYRRYAMQGANVLVVPSCFTKTTGQAHWEALLRARAIENLSYVLAPNQVGRDARATEAYGNSMIIDPWGRVLARASNDKEEIIYAEINMDQIKEARLKLPSVLRKGSYGKSR